MAPSIWIWPIFPKAFPFGEGGTAYAVTDEVASHRFIIKGDFMVHNHNLTPRAQELRRNMTKEERRLWFEYLRNHPYRFRRQVAFGRYILDFYCAAAKLAVELDGSQHYDPEIMQYDQSRTAFFERNGIQIIRFSNTDVLQNLRGVCEAIDLAINDHIK